MKSFLVKDKKPIIRWGSLPDETYFEGNVPEGYSLAISPWGYDGYVIIDVDRHEDKNGFDAIPQELKGELSQTLHYPTKNNGMHYWVKYTGSLPLANKTSGLGIDLRTNKGYVVWYPKTDIRDHIKNGEIKESSERLNKWLEKLFSYREVLSETL